MVLVVVVVCVFGCLHGSQRVGCFWTRASTLFWGTIIMPVSQQCMQCSCICTFVPVDVYIVIALPCTYNNMFPGYCSCSEAWGCDPNARVQHHHVGEGFWLLLRAMCDRDCAMRFVDFTGISRYVIFWALTVYHTSLCRTLWAAVA